MSFYRKCKKCFEIKDKTLEFTITFGFCDTCCKSLDGDFNKVLCGVTEVRRRCLICSTIRDKARHFTISWRCCDACQQTCSFNDSQEIIATASDTMQPKQTNVAINKMAEVGTDGQISAEVAALLATDTLGVVEAALLGGNEWCLAHIAENENAQEGCIPWIVEMAALAPKNKTAKKILRQLLAMKGFTFYISPFIYPTLQQALQQRLAALGSALRDLPANADGIDLTFGLASLMAPETTQPGYRATQLEVLGGLLSAEASGMGWDYDNPILMHERVVIYLLILIGLTIERAFHAKVKEIGQLLFGDDFDGFTAAPLKSYARMCGKLMSAADHRNETMRPRPALNVDVVRCLVALPEITDISTFLEFLARETGGFVKVKNKYTYSPEELEGEYHLRLVLVSVKFDMNQTIGEAIADSEVQCRWEKLAAMPSYHDNEPLHRRALLVTQAIELLKSSVVANLPLAMVCEVQVVTQSTAKVRQQMHELFRISRAPSPETLFKDYGRAAQPEPTDLLSAAEQGELPEVEKYFSDEMLDVTDDHGRSALLLAATFGHTEVVDFLLSHNADVNSCRPDGWTALHCAAYSGSLETVVMLLSHKASTEKTQNTGLTSLFISAQHGHWDVVECLLRAGADKDHADDDGVTPLYIAAQHGHLDVVRCLLQAGANGNCVANDGSTPLYIAAQNGFLGVVCCLLQAGADEDEANNDGITPLGIAANFGHWEVVECLLQAGANKCHAANYLLHPLCGGARNGHLEVVRCLLEAGADKNQATNDGFTPLHYAAQRGHLEVVQYLLRAGADKDYASNSDHTPLLLAAKNGHLDVVLCLLQAGADKDHASNDGFTPLLNAAHKGHFEVLECLLEAGADQHKAANIGVTALHLAALSGRLDMVQCLLQAGANKDQSPNDASTALPFAAMKGYLEVVRCLLEAGANKDQASNDGRTPLHYAAQHGHLEIVQCLLQAGADKDYASNDGFTPLYVSALNGHLDVVLCLLQAGADKDYASNDGFTALSIAEQNGHLEVVQCLL